MELTLLGTGYPQPNPLRVGPSVGDDLMTFEIGA